MLPKQSRDRSWAARSTASTPPAPNTASRPMRQTSSRCRAAIALNSWLDWIVRIRPGNSHYRKEVKFMEYQKPEITLLNDAVQAIQAAKPGLMVDSINPNDPQRSGSAYESDE